MELSTVFDGIAFFKENDKKKHIISFSLVKVGEVIYPVIKTINREPICSLQDHLYDLDTIIENLEEYGKLPHAITQNACAVCSTPTDNKYCSKYCLQNFQRIKKRILGAQEQKDGSLEFGRMAVKQIGQYAIAVAYAKTYHITVVPLLGENIGGKIFAHQCTGYRVFKSMDGKTYMLYGEKETPPRILNTASVFCQLRYKETEQ